MLTRLAKVVCLQLPDESDRFVGAVVELYANLSSKDLSPALSTLCRLKDIVTFPKHLGILLKGLATSKSITYYVCILDWRIIVKKYRHTIKVVQSRTTEHLTVLSLYLFSSV